MNYQIALTNMFTGELMWDDNTTFVKKWGFARLVYNLQNKWLVAYDTEDGRYSPIRYTSATGIDGGSE